MTPFGVPSNWRGGRRINAWGYVVVNAPKNYEGKIYAGNVVLEHRLVMADMLGRPMQGYETVHHRNGIKTDNRPENLELRIGHHGEGATRHCPTCTCNEAHSLTR